VKKFFAAALPAAIIFLSAFSRPALAADDPCSQPVSTTEGQVRGKLAAGADVCTWKGIPYAAPPVGELRFRATQPAKAHQGIFDTYEFGHSCSQKPSAFSGFGGGIKPPSEDCLTLNIWSPQKPGKYPVMVWIHGGGFIGGGASSDLYDGTNLAGLKDVVVSINYRLGALGFLSLPELAAEDPNHSTGNYGILDQVQALKWVQQNISQFGGDPGNVTIFGQSAGGASVGVLLISPLAKGLFQRAIPMSGSYNFIPAKERGYDKGRETAKRAGCKGNELLACLRKKPVAAFQPKNIVLEFLSGFNSGTGYSPKLDGYVITCQPVECIEQGRYNQVPVMMGYTREEMRFFSMALPSVNYLPRFAVNKLIRVLTGCSSKEVSKFYSYSDYKHPFDLFVAEATDFYTAMGFPVIEALSKHTPVYFYSFDWASKYGAFHGLDIPFVFGYRDLNSKIARKVLAGNMDAAIPLAEKMMAYYVNFAKTGDPNGQGLPAWPKYSVEKKECIHLDNQVTVGPVSSKDLARYEYFIQKSKSDEAVK